MLDANFSAMLLASSAFAVVTTANAGVYALSRISASADATPPASSGRAWTLMPSRRRAC